MRNIYFNDKVRSEQDLYESLVIESMQLYGQDVYYLPRTIVNKDPILFDDIPSHFPSSYKIEMYIDNVDGFSGEGHLFSKFGIEIRDQATFIVSRRRWAETVSSFDNDIDGDLPQEGDLIYLPLSKSIFQIMLVEREVPFYQLSNLNVVKLECELFEYNDETLDTGIAEIDNVETLGYELKLTLDADSDQIPIIIGDIITETLNDGTKINAEIVDWDRNQQILSVSHVGATDGNFHIFDAGSVFTTQQTTAVRTILAVNEDLGDFGHQNDAFDSDVGFLDFSEDNPFGSPE